MDGINNLRDFLSVSSDWLRLVPFLFIFGLIISFFRKDYNK